MMTLFTSALPILLGFVAKLIALKSQAASENQKLMIQSLQVRNDSINQARDRADKESPMAAWNRRFIIIVILGLIIFTQVAPVWFDVPTVVPTVVKGFSFFGLQITPDVVEYVTVEGMLKFDEIFKWATMIIEFYFGAQLAKGK
ncbi:MAG: hypothetical protein QF535_12850 [Anaerolineales bacterium]|jgi:hypothetical protein|nr:hypothetical protein [Anaerolineales bacterium]|tara:strand:- start:1426 stop:1857 length:432 start_codon:yes stop_codon:yes gene_type:complete